MNKHTYEDLLHDVMITLDGCSHENAAHIVSLCVRLNADPTEFVKQLPQLTGKAKPTYAEVAAKVEEIAANKGLATSGVSFPPGYVNRKELRRIKQQAARDRRRLDRVRKTR